MDGEVTIDRTDFHNESQSDIVKVECDVNNNAETAAAPVAVKVELVDHEAPAINDAGKMGEMWEQYLATTSALLGEGEELQQAFDFSQTNMPVISDPSETAETEALAADLNVDGLVRDFRVWDDVNENSESKVGRQSSRPKLSSKTSRVCRQRVDKSSRLVTRPTYYGNREWTCSRCKPMNIALWEARVDLVKLSTLRGINADADENQINTDPARKRLGESNHDESAARNNTDDNTPCKSNCNVVLEEKSAVSSTKSLQVKQTEPRVSECVRKGHQNPSKNETMSLNVDDFTAGSLIASSRIELKLFDDCDSEEKVENFTYKHASQKNESRQTANDNKEGNTSLTASTCSKLATLSDVGSSEKLKSAAPDEVLAVDVSKNGTTGDDSEANQIVESCDHNKMQRVGKRRNNMPQERKARQKLSPLSSDWKAIRPMKHACRSRLRVNYGVKKVKMTKQKSDVQSKSEESCVMKYRSIGSEGSSRCRLITLISDMTLRRPENKNNDVLKSCANLSCLAANNPNPTFEVVPIVVNGDLLADKGVSLVANKPIPNCVAADDTICSQMATKNLNLTAKDPNPSCEDKDNAICSHQVKNSDCFEVDINNPVQSMKFNPETPAATSAGGLFLVATSVLLAKEQNAAEWIEMVPEADIAPKLEPEESSIDSVIAKGDGSVKRKGNMTTGCTVPAPKKAKTKLKTQVLSCETLCPSVKQRAGVKCGKHIGKTRKKDKKKSECQREKHGIKTRMTHASKLHIQDTLRPSISSTRTSSLGTLEKTFIPAEDRLGQHPPENPAEKHTKRKRRKEMKEKNRPRREKNEKGQVLREKKERSEARKKKKERKARRQMKKKAKRKASGNQVTPPLSKQIEAATNQTVLDNTSSLGTSEKTIIPAEDRLGQHPPENPAEKHTKRKKRKEMKEKNRPRGEKNEKGQVLREKKERSEARKKKKERKARRQMKKKAKRKASDNQVTPPLSKQIEAATNQTVLDNTSSLGTSEKTIIPAEDRLGQHPPENPAEKDTKRKRRKEMKEKNRPRREKNEKGQVLREKKERSEARKKKKERKARRQMKKKAKREASDNQVTPPLSKQRKEKTFNPAEDGLGQHPHENLAEKHTKRKRRKAKRKASDHQVKLPLSSQIETATNQTVLDKIEPKSVADDSTSDFGRVKPCKIQLHSIITREADHRVRPDQHDATDLSPCMENPFLTAVETNENAGRHFQTRFSGFCARSIPYFQYRIAKSFKEIRKESRSKRQKVPKEGLKGLRTMVTFKMSRDKDGNIVMHADQNHHLTEKWLI